LIFILMIPLLSCDTGPLSEDCRPSLPVLPESWGTMLGTPHWHLEWISPGGEKQSVEVPPGTLPPALELGQEWTTPVIAWPYWPQKGVEAGLARPAGALFPLDYSGGAITLSWSGGVEAFFYQRLAAGAGKTSELSTPRFPWYFDWPRFREVLQSQDIQEKLKGDPWLADWDEVALKTLRSSFDKRSIKPTAKNSLVFRDPESLDSPGPDIVGRWASSSPLGTALDIEEDQAVEVPVRVETWFSDKGLIKTSSTGWIYRPYK